MLLFLALCSIPAAFQEIFTLMCMSLLRALQSDHFVWQVVH